MTTPNLKQIDRDEAAFSEIVQLSRTLSPALIAEYQTQLPDKKLLQAKLHEFYLQNAPEGEEL